MRWHVERGPVVRAAGMEDRLARVTKTCVVDDQFLHKQQINQIAEAFVAFARSRRQGHAVQLLRDVDGEADMGVRRDRSRRTRP